MMNGDDDYRLMIPCYYTHSKKFFRIMRHILVLILLIVSCNLVVAKDESSVDSNAVVTNSFWDNWFAQVGGDMILLFPSHHAVKDLFPNGKSLGVSVAAGKWFSPVFGGKIKANWNNVIIREKFNTFLTHLEEDSKDAEDLTIKRLEHDIL